MRTKQRGFTGDDSEPDPDTVAGEVAVRTAEMRGSCRLWLALTEDGDEPMGALAYYSGNGPGEDWFIFSLSARPPFRRRGVARAMLAHAVREALDPGAARSIVINCDPEDWPQAWYRRFGFTDEVYWCRTYAAPPGS